MTNRLISNVHSDSSDLATIVSSFFLDPRNRILELSPTFPKTKIYMTGGYPIKLNDKWWVLDTPQDLSISSILDTGSISWGKDYYFYVCDNNGVIDFKISLNSTYPSGYTADTSYKLGGFHTLISDVGTISGHPLTGYVATNILPDSIWDLRHRPRADTAGMAYSEETNLWSDIYLASTGGSIGGGAILLKTWIKAVMALRLWNKRFMSDEECSILAQGSSDGTSSFATSRTTTGGNIDTLRRVISGIGLEDMTVSKHYWLSTQDTYFTSLVAKGTSYILPEDLSDGTLLTWGDAYHPSTLNRITKMMMYAFITVEIDAYRNNGPHARSGEYTLNSISIGYRGVCNPIL
jgi:hypothetical protein